MTQKVKYKFGLLGENVGYSRSSEIFGRILEADDVSGVFETINCGADYLARRALSMADSGFDGFSVTIPHKEAIIPTLKQIDVVASALGAVNSVKITSRGLMGFNTDTYGFTQPLLPSSSKLKGRRAIVLGAGGAARAVIYSLALDFEIESVLMIGRDQKRLASSQSALKTALPRLSLATLEWKTAINPNLAFSDSCALMDTALVVNASPLGGPNSPVEDISCFLQNTPSGLIYYDLNYNTDNALLQRAERQGLDTLSGLPMLIHQALRSYQIWTGREVSFDSVNDLINNGRN